MEDLDKLLEILRNFEQEHRDLDQILIQLQEKSTVDFLQIQRLKKRIGMMVPHKRIWHLDLILRDRWIIESYFFNWDGI